jgi:hypothetical protein
VFLRNLSIHLRDCAMSQHRRHLKTHVWGSFMQNMIWILNSVSYYSRYS